MKRKIIKQGLGGFTVYLPKKWIDKKGIKGGQEIEIVESGNDLLIKSRSSQKKTSIVTITDDNKNDLKIILTHLYRKGFDAITVQNIEDDVLKEIKSITQNKFIGFEITDKTKDTCTISNISEPTGEKFDVILRKIFLIIKETQNTLIKDFKQEKFNHMTDMEEYRMQADKYILFCRRIITKETCETEPLLMWELLTFLTHIQHNHYYLYSYASKNKFTFEKNIIDSLDNMAEYFNLYYDAFFSEDIVCIHKINNLKDKYQFGRCIKDIESSTGKNAMIYSYIREIFRMIQIGSSPILCELIDKKDISGTDDLKTSSYKVHHRRI